MPRRELKAPEQVEQWLVELGAALPNPGELTLIGSGGLLWHAYQRGLNFPLPENSMDVDPITNSEDVARLCYEAIIGSDFERTHGWHVNLMPESVLREFPRLAGARFPKILFKRYCNGPITEGPPNTEAEAQRASRSRARFVGKSHRPDIVVLW